MSKLPKLPIKDPTKLKNRQSVRYFYEHTIKGLLPHVIDITLQGIKINYNEVDNLRKIIDDVLISVDKRLEANPLVKEYQDLTYISKKKSYVEEQISKQRSYGYYLRDFKPSDMSHRSYYMETYISSHPTKTLWIPELGKLPNGKPKWSAKDVKDFANNNQTHAANVEFFWLKNDSWDNEISSKAMTAIAVDKTSLYNAKYTNAIKTVSKDKLVEPFNPGSAKQKTEFFRLYGIDCEAFSKDTGAPSWNREQIERINRETNNEDMKDFTQAIIDHSFSAIIKNNFIAAFDKYCINDTLYGNLRLGGAKSFRLTSQNP